MGKRRQMEEVPLLTCTDGLGAPVRGRGRLPSLGAAVLLAAAWLPCVPARAEGDSVRKLFEQALPNVPGKTLTAVEVDYAPGGRSGPHRHPASGVVFAYVLAGAIRSQVEGGPVAVFRAGESWFGRRPPTTSSARMPAAPSPPACSPCSSPIPAPRSRPSTAEPRPVTVPPRRPKAGPPPEAAAWDIQGGWRRRRSCWGGPLNGVRVPLRRGEGRLLPGLGRLLLRRDLHAHLPGSSRAEGHRAGERSPSRSGSFNCSSAT